MATLTNLIAYDSQERRKREYVRRFDLSGTEDWFPFHFEYTDLLYGLVFQPLNLGWRQLDTVEDLFTLLFELSFVQWLYTNGLGNSAEELGQQYFQIPPMFHTRSLSLIHKRRCSDPLQRIPVFLPHSLPLESYTVEELELIIKWLEIDDPRHCKTPSNDPLKDKREPELVQEASKLLVGETVAEKLRSYVVTALQILNRPLWYPPSRSRTPEIFKAKTLSDPPRWIRYNQVWADRHLTTMSLYCKSLADYKVIAFLNLNRNCRTDGEIFYLPAVRLLKAFHFVSPIPTDMIVHRNIVVHPRKFPIDKYLPGKVVTEEAIVSTSLLPRTDPMFYFTFHVPRGFPAIAMFLFIDFEHELLLPPGTRYRVTDYKQEGRVHWFTADVLPFTSPSNK